MSQMLALLNEVRSHRLAMYIGTVSLGKFADFLRGYEHAVYRLMPLEKDVFLAEFSDWIYRRFQMTENISWERLILKHSADEADAVNRFWEFLDEFLEQQQRTVSAVPVGDACAPARPGKW